MQRLLICAAIGIAVMLGSFTPTPVSAHKGWHGHHHHGWHHRHHRHHCWWNFGKRHCRWW
jgi:Spy/CpxP family protein refolding chaperone